VIGTVDAAPIGIELAYRMAGVVSALAEHARSLREAEGGEQR